MTHPSPSDNLTDAAPPLPVFKYLGRLAPLLILWIGLIGWLGWLMYSRAHWSRESDEADMREWLDETRVFRKSLPELIREYVSILEDPDVGPQSDRARLKHAELIDHLRALAEPTRAYTGKLPLFPDIYVLTVQCVGVPAPHGLEHPSWISPIPRPDRLLDSQSSIPSPTDAATSQNRLRILQYDLPGSHTGISIRCEYRLHTYNTFQRDRRSARTNQLIALGVLIPTSVLVVFFVIRFLKRQREQEVRQWRERVAAEHRERELLETRVKQQDAEHELLEARVKQQDAERATEELGRRLLEGELEKAKIESRASEAEKSAWNSNPSCTPASESWPGVTPTTSRTSWFVPTTYSLGAWKPMG